MPFSQTSDEGKPYLLYVPFRWEVETLTNCYIFARFSLGTMKLPCVA